MQRTLIIAASVIVILGILIAVYFVFFAPSAPTLTSSANPFQDSGAADTGSTSNTNTDTGVIQEGAGKQIAAKFVQITDKPVAAGFIALFVPAPKALATTSSSTPADISATVGPDTDIRYIDRASGNVYSYKVRAQSSTRLSNKTVPGVQTASWVSDGSLALTQYLSKEGAAEHVETYALPALGEGGYFLEQDLGEVLVSASSSVFSLVTNSSGSIGTLSKADGSGAHTAFSSTLSQLLVHFSGKGLVATTKASAGIPGYAFSIDSKGAFTRILGALNGLSALPSPSGKSILFSYVDQGAIHLAVLTVATQTVTQLPVATFTEKCVWASDENSIFCAVPKALSGTLPDDWYQGAVTFSDRIWQINLSSRLATLVVDPSLVAKTDMDIQNLTLDPKTSVLVFMNRTNEALYAYSL
jgi:hypothetical protein